MDVEVDEDVELEEVVLLVVLLKAVGWLVEVAVVATSVLVLAMTSGVWVFLREMF